MNRPDHVACPRLLVSREALTHNLALLRDAAPGARICAVVKADAYGHHATGVVRLLAGLVDGHAENPAVHQFAVASVEESLDLPTVEQPVIILRAIEEVYLAPNRSTLEQAIRRGKRVFSLMSPEAAGDLARLAETCGARADVQVMIDTGMTRCGVAPDKLTRLLDRIHSLAGLRLVGLATHLTSSEDPNDPATREQLDRFIRLTDPIKQRHPGILRHACNSGGILHWPTGHLDMVRPGIALYGIDPSGTYHPRIPLRPVARWVAPILHIHDVPAGATVGYNRTFTTTRDSRIGLIPVGYADGYPRILSNNARLIVRDVDCPLVGRVSMDLITVDLTDCPDARVGDDATLLSDDPLSPCSAYVLARDARTIAYELFTRIGPRIRRVLC